MLIQPRIFADFHNADPQGRLRLSCVGTLRDIARLGIQLSVGMELIFTDEELEVEGIVEWSTDENRWVAVIDWDAIRIRPNSSVDESA